MNVIIAITDKKMNKMLTKLFNDNNHNVYLLKDLESNIFLLKKLDILIADEELNKYRENIDLIPAKIKIMFAKEKTKEEEIRYLRMGAHEYLKEFNLEMFNLRIKNSILLKYGKREANKINFEFLKFHEEIEEAFELDRETESVIYKDKNLYLESEEYRVFEFMNSRINQFLTSEQIIEKLDLYDEENPIEYVQNIIKCIAKKMKRVIYIDAIVFDKEKGIKLFNID